MFLVRDKVEDREKRVRGFLDTEDEASIALILSAVHFEWTVRRAILALGKSSNKSIRKKMKNKKYWGLDGFKDLWKEEVCEPRLADVVIKNWGQFRKAFECRHKLVHGVESCSKKFASQKVEPILTAASDIWNFCKKKNIFLGKRLPVRKEKKQHLISLR